MPAMAQRTAAEVNAIMKEHAERLVEVAFVDCVTCGRRKRSLYGGTDIEVTAEFVKDGWDPRKGVGWLCPEHKRQGRYRCGAPTYNDRIDPKREGTCRRFVKHEGGRCEHHREEQP